MPNSHIATLFTSPKRGGILQSSGFLHLKSLISLSQTCKSNALDELSLILYIENDITRYHKVCAAIDMLSKVYREFLNWLKNREFEIDDSRTTEARHDTDSGALQL